MAQIVIRNIPEPVMEEFRELTRRRGTSMEQEVRELIAAAVSYDGRLQQFRASARRHANRILKDGRVFSDSTHLIREDRER